LWSGILMLLLFYVESAGVPLVFALAHALSPSPQQALAVVFTLSNLLPALTMLPLLGRWWKMLEQLWPGTPVVTPGKPKFLVPQALEHPTVALELLRRELARLLGFLPGRQGEVADSRNSRQDAADEPAAAFVRLAGAVENFSVKLAARGELSEKQMGQLQRLRAALSGIRHLEEAVRFYRHRSTRMPDYDAAANEKLEEVLDDLLHRVTAAVDRGDEAALEVLQAESKRHGPVLEKLRGDVLASAKNAGVMEIPALMEDFELVAWTLHRILKVLCQLPGNNPGKTPGPAAA